MRVDNRRIRPSSLGFSPLPGTWLMVVIAVISISATGVAAVAPATDASPQSTAALVETTGDVVPEAGGETPTATSVPTGAESTVEGRTTPESDTMNHGQVVRQVGDLTDGSNRGCVTRQVAGSDLGKKNADPDPDGPSLLPDGSIDPDSVDLDCVNGGSQSPAGEDASPSKATENPGKATENPGKATENPGKGKENPAKGEEKP